MAILHWEHAMSCDKTISQIHYLNFFDKINFMWRNVQTFYSYFCLHAVTYTVKYKHWNLVLVSNLYIKY